MVVRIHFIVRVFVFAFWKIARMLDCFGEASSSAYAALGLILIYLSLKYMYIAFFSKHIADAACEFAALYPIANSIICIAFVTFTPNYKDCLSGFFMQLHSF